LVKVAAYNRIFNYLGICHSYVYEQLFTLHRQSHSEANHPFNNYRSHYLYVQSAALQLCQGKLLFYAASHLEKNVRYPFYLADTIFYSFLYFVHHDPFFRRLTKSDVAYVYHDLLFSLLP